ncbi:MAG: metallophosphoesterase [Candidatus Omnitrophica bacterium]|nr:metallophosphoesterase [Candidatus Omnitrophota bacterium]
MKKIIHISDLHVGYKDNAERFYEIVEKITLRWGGRAGDHVIVITGDLVDNANNTGNYHEVKVGLKAFKEAGFEHILVVPGNHDYGTGEHGDKKFVELFHQAFYGDQRGFPRKDIIGDVAFIGLDSMAEELHWYDELWAEGEVGGRQLRVLGEMLKSEDVVSCQKRVIYLHHHPFDFRPLHQLKDSSKLKKVLSEVIAEGVSIDAILYGHNHEGKAHNGQWGIPQCYDAGAATLKPRPKYVDWMPWFKTRSSIRVIDLEQRTASKLL